MSAVHSVTPHEELYKAASSANSYEEFYNKISEIELVNEMFSSNEGGITLLHSLIPAGLNWDETGIQYYYKFLADRAVQEMGTVDLAENEHGVTPLMMTAATCNAQAVKILLDQKAGPNKKDKYGANSMHYALLYGGTDLRSRKETILKLIISGGNKETLRNIPERHPGLDSPMTKDLQEIVDEVLLKKQDSNKSE